MIVRINVEGRNVVIEKATKEDFVTEFMSQVSSGNIGGDYEDMTIGELRETANDLWDESAESEAAAAATPNTEVEVKVTVSGVKKSATGAIA